MSIIKQGTDNIYETKNKNNKNRVVIGIKERRFHVWLESTPLLVEETDCDKRPYIWQNQYNIVKLKKKKKNMEFLQEMSLEGGTN